MNIPLLTFRPKKRNFLQGLLVCAVLLLSFTCFSIPKSSAVESGCAVISSSTTLDYAALDRCGYPSPNTAGVPSGTTLTPVSSINCTNTTIDSVTTTGDVNVGNNCKIQNSKISGVAIDDGVTGVQFLHDEITGPYTGSSGSPNCTFSQGSGNNPGSGNEYDVHAMGAADAVTVDHSYLHCAAEPFNGNGIVKDSYIISDECWGPCNSDPSTTTHNEAVYIAGGNNAAKDGSYLDHNTTVMMWEQTASIFGDDHAFGPIRNLTVIDNLIVANDADHLHTTNTNSGNIGITIQNNRYAFVSSTAPFGTNNPSIPLTATQWCGNFSDASPTTYYDINGGTGGSACPQPGNETGGSGATTYGPTNLATLLSHYGNTSGMTSATGDLDGNGTVSVYDLSKLLSNYSS
jgi:hypothetical protein